MSQNLQTYDVIIVGARIAGSSLAKQLAERGHKVLLLEKGRRGQDTVSTHFVMPRGASYLNRLGLLDQVLETTPSGRFFNIVMDGIPLRGEVTVDAQVSRFERLHGKKADGIQPLYFSARRQLIDTIVRDAAVQAGAKIEESFTVTDLVFDGERVAGVRGRNRHGQTVEIRGRMVIGADGRKSSVAELLKLPKIDPRDACTFACYSYFVGEGLGTEARIEKLGRLAIALAPTNDGAHMVLVYGPKNYYSAFQKDRAANFFKTLNMVNPDIAEAVRDARRMEPYYSTADQSAFLRKAAGPGFALIGDAACFKDQCTATGMTHALRDAELLADHLLPALENDGDLDSAGNSYSEKRYVDSARYYDFVCQQAEMNPLRPDERTLFQALRESPEQTNRFLAVYGDTLPVREFFSEQSVKEIMRPLLKRKFEPHSHPQSVFQNPFIEKLQIEKEEVAALSGNCADFAIPQGPDLIQRTQSYYEFYSARLDRDAFQYSRTLKTFPGPSTEMIDDGGRSIRGLNFASQDYLGLGGHPAIREAAREALEEFGPHSAGSPMVIGNTTLSKRLEDELAEMLRVEHVLLYPTGYAAGYGSVAALVRSNDYVVMDRLTHSCLQNGVSAVTKNVLRFPHLDNEAVRAYLKDIRSRDVRNGIMVISEGVFSMDADSPRISELQSICHEYSATLLVDIAHDFGASGPGGTGQIGIQSMLGKVDLVMGSFSKSFASNGGFLATRSPAVKQYAKMYGSSHMFSNAISPIQSAVALTACKIIRDAEGDRLRLRLLEVVNVLRDELKGYGLECLGLPGAIVPVMIGEERVARVCHRLFQKRNIAVMILEYPVVALGAARIRLQVMATHTIEDAKTVARQIAEVVAEARDYVRRFEQGAVQAKDESRTSSV